ncbi:MAG TPA: VWA domain-containing protein [Candidatus Krumholzibacteria bacterium]|nr:VWA domain-containing protein [Candidatus Krumholzibacteria bacterium]
MRQHPDVVLAATLAVLFAAAHTAAQDPPQAPTFRTGVDLVPVDVNVLDRTGRPVPGLEATDFVLTVDGQPRRVASAQYITSVRDAEPVPATPSHYSSNISAAGGRMIMFAVDQANIGSGRGRVALESARKFVERLSPADRVGVVALPGAGPQVDFTANHVLVHAMLGRIVGQDSGFQGAYRVGMHEATEINRGNQLLLTEVVNRECTGMRGVELELCRRQIATDAMTMVTLGRERARSSLTALRHLIERMALTPSQKTIIFISEGLLLDREFSDVSWLAPAAARAQVVLYVLQLEAPAFDASIARPSPMATQDRALAEEGLGVLAGMTRGSVLRVVSSADTVFQRLALELSGYYLLSFEPEPGDRDGKPHKIAVTVPNRKDISIRSRREFVVGETAMRTAEEMLGETLRAPLLSSDIGLKLSTYTLREGDGQKLRILFAAEIDRSRNPTEKISLASILLDAKGTLAGSLLEKDLSTPIRAATRTQDFVSSIAVNSPGLYTLKVAVVDSRGTRGSVEHAFRAQLSSAGQVRVTDLLIGERSATAGRVLPTVAGEFSSDVVHGYIELYSDAEEALKDTTVEMEVATSEEGRALDRAAARLLAQPAEGPGRRTAEAVLPIALLPPGDYVVRAIINIGGKRTGLVTRPFSIPKTRIAEPAAPVNAGPSRPPIAFTSRIDAFDRKAVLTPDVVGFFMQRMNYGPGGAPGAPAAIEHARSGRFQEAIETLGGAQARPVAAAFLSGLALYSKGELEAAAGKFREALKLDSEFFPAAFYLGSCYAAGGRDRQAVGAWQTSLVTESDAPFIYTLLADGFMRLREPHSALNILKEAMTIWPDNDQVLLRMGTAYAAGGKRSEALAILEPYLDRNPTDHERTFLVLQTLYEARAAGTSVKSPAEDRALFDKYAAAYAAAKGPQAEMVEIWRKAVRR